MILGERFKRRVKEIISDPNLDKPIANLTKDFTSTGTITLITKIKYGK